MFAAGYTPGAFKRTVANGDYGRRASFFLATSQRSLVSPNVVKIAPDFGISLGGHPLVIVKIDRLVGHDPGAFTRNPGRSLDGEPVVIGGATATFVFVDLGFLGSRLPRL